MRRPPSVGFSAWQKQPSSPAPATPAAPQVASPSRVVRPAAVSAPAPTPTNVEEVRRVWDWNTLTRRHPNKITPYIHTLRQCCTNEQMRDEAVRLQATFSGSDLPVPFVWALLAAVQKPMLPKWMASGSDASSRRCMYYNYGVREFSCNKADGERHLHKEYHRCFMCGGPHPLVGWELEGKPAENYCREWNVLTEELRQLAGEVHVTPKDLVIAFFGEDNRKPTEKLTVTERVVRVVPSSGGERKPAWGRPEPEQSSSPSSLPEVFDDAPVAETPAPNLDLSEQRRANFVKYRNDVLREQYRIQVKQKTRTSMPGDPKHNLRSTAVAGALQKYTIFCDKPCCLVTKEATRHRVLFGHYFATEDPNEVGRLVVVKEFQNVNDENLRAKSQFEKEKQVAMRLQAILEAHSDVVDDSNVLHTLLVMPFYTSSLRMLLAEREAEGINDDERLQIVQSLVGTMRKLHEGDPKQNVDPIVHGDVKPSNILVFDDSDDASTAGGAGLPRFRTQFCDFEFSSIRDNGPAPSSVVQASAFWAHPMQWITAGVSLKKYDLWALALVLYEVLHFRKQKADDDRAAPLFFNDVFPGSIAEKRTQFSEMEHAIVQHEKKNLSARIDFLRLPKETNVLLLDFMNRLMCEPNPNLRDPSLRGHLLLVPPAALAQGMLELRANEKVITALASTDAESHFKRLDAELFDEINKQRREYFFDFRQDQDQAVQKSLKYREMRNTDLITLGQGVRVLRNLLAHPKSSFTVSCLYFKAPEFLLALGAKLAELKVRIKSDGHLEVA